MSAETTKAVLTLVHIIGSAIREAGEIGIPSGHLYAMLMGKVTLEQYEAVVNLLKRQKIISESNHLLTYIA